MKIVSIRASSLGELFDCPARWASKYIYNMRIPTSSKALLGTAIHASTAKYDQSVLDNSQLTIEETKSVAVDTIHNPQEDILWEDDKPQDLENIALSLHAKYCSQISPNQNYKAIEVKCESLIIKDLGIELTGTTDRIYEDKDGNYGIADLKTGKSAVNSNGIAKTEGHSYQMGVYELLAEQATGIPIDADAQIIGLNTAKSPDYQRIGLGSISNAKEILLGNEYESGILEEASKIIHSGNFFGNPRSILCNKKYCPAYQNCKFRK